MQYPLAPGVPGLLEIRLVSPVMREHAREHYDTETAREILRLPVEFPENPLTSFPH
jgi:hypothetical protein